MHKFWCCGRPSRYAGQIPDNLQGQAQQVKAPHGVRQETTGFVQAADSPSWVAEAAMCACTSLAEVAASRSSANSWPSRLLAQLQTINSTLVTSVARLALFARTPTGTATCVVTAFCPTQLPWERPPAAAIGWSRTALHDRLAKQYDLQDFETVTVVSRYHDPVHGPDVAALSSHCYGTTAGAAGTAGGGAGSGPHSPGGSSAAANWGPQPQPPLQLRTGDLLALPITSNGRVVAALLLGWGGSEAGGGGGAAGADRGRRFSGAGISKPHAQQQRQQHQKQVGSVDALAAVSAATAAAAAAATAGGGLTLRPADLRELRRLAQFLGFGLFSDPQQAAYLEQVAALISDISHGASTGLHDVVLAVLDAVPCLLQTKLALTLQSLLAAVLGNSLPAVVFARRPGASGGTQIVMSTNNSLIGVTRGAHSIIVCSPTGGGGAAAAAASPAKMIPGTLGSLYGNTGVDSRSGSRKYLGRDPSLHSLAVGTPGAMRSSDLLGCDVPSGAMGHGGGTTDGGVEGAAGSGVSRVKAVRTALAYTLLQRVLKVGSYSVCGAEDQAEVPPHGPAITPLVVPNASSQVLEEEQPGRDVLLAANLTGAGVACLVLCAEAPPPPAQANGGGGGAWSPQGPMWASANAAVAAASIPGLDGSWGTFGGGEGVRISRGGGHAEAGGGGAHDAAAASTPGVDVGGSRGIGGSAVGSVAAAAAAAAAAMMPLLPGGVSTPSGLSYGGGTLPTAAGMPLPFRLALYLVSGDAAPAGVLEAVAEEMKGLLPLVFGAVHAAIAAGGTATSDFCVLQGQVIQRATTSGTLDFPNLRPAPALTPAERRGPPLSPLLVQPPGHAHPHGVPTPGGPSPHHHNGIGGGGGSTPRSPGSAPPKSPRTGTVMAGSPSGVGRRSSLGGIGSASRSRLASPGPAPPSAIGAGGAAAAAPAVAGDVLVSHGALSLSSTSSSHDRNDGPADGGGGKAGGGGRDGGSGAAGAARGGAPRHLRQENMDDMVISTAQMQDYDVGSSTPFLRPAAYSLVRKISAPCYVLSSPVLRLEDVAGPRPLELLVTSARTRLTAVAAGSDAGEEARLSVSQDLAAVDLHEVIGSGGQGVVFRGTLHGLETAVKVWEHNGRAPLEHDGEWLSAEVQDINGNGSANDQHPKVPDALLRDGAAQQQANGGQGGVEPVASSRDCIRQAKRGAMEVAVTVTLSHPNVVQPYAHFSDVVVVERQPAAPPPPGGPNPGPLQLRLCAHDDPVFRGQKAGPLNTVLCLEYCDAGTLLSAARRGDFRLPESGPRDGPVWPDLVPLYTSLLEVSLPLRYLHSRRLVHCDLKPGNVLLKTSTRDPRGWTCKLSDFGCVRLMDEMSPEGVPGFRMAQVFGTVAYMSPECFSKGRLLGPGVDVYAFGVLMWELMHCKLPHAGIDPKELPRMVARSNLRPEFHPLAPPDYKALACSCWAASPDRRPTATQLVSQLQQLLGTAKAAAMSQQLAHRRQMSLRQVPPAPMAPQPPPPQQLRAQLQLPPQQQQQQQQPSQLLHQKRSLMRFPSAQSAGRLCDRVVREQAHHALVQQAQQQAQQGLSPRGPDAPSSPHVPQRIPHPQRPQPRINPLGAYPGSMDREGNGNAYTRSNLQQQ